MWGSISYQLIDCIIINNAQIAKITTGNSPFAICIVISSLSVYTKPDWSKPLSWFLLIKGGGRGRGWDGRLWVRCSQKEFWDHQILAIGNPLWMPEAKGCRRDRETCDSSGLVKEKREGKIKKEKWFYLTILFFYLFDFCCLFIAFLFQRSS